MHSNKINLENVRLKNLNNSNKKKICLCGGFSARLNTLMSVIALQEGIIAVGRISQI